MRTKTLTAPVEFKADGKEGEFEIVFSTIGVVDKDRDIVLNSAIEDGLKLPLLRSHMWQSLAVGAGVTKTEKDNKILDGGFFLNTPDGEAAFKTTKSLIEAGVNQEFSWGFKVTEQRDPTDEERERGAENVIVKTIPREVSLVLVGAGEGTHVQSLKSFDEQIVSVFDAMDDVINRASSRAANRDEQERPLGKADVDRLERLQAKLQELLSTAHKQTAAGEDNENPINSLRRIKLQLELGRA